MEKNTEKTEQQYSKDAMNRILLNNLFLNIDTIPCLKEQTKERLIKWIFLCIEAKRKGEFNSEPLTICYYRGCGITTFIEWLNQNSLGIEFKEVEWCPKGERLKRNNVGTGNIIRTYSLPMEEEETITKCSQNEFTIAIKRFSPFYQLTTSAHFIESISEELTIKI